VTFSVDGNVYETHTPADTNGNPWVFDHPFYLLLNLAVGGNWPGSPDGTTSFPQQMIVDYVHVYDSTGPARA
jgi:beta-glucanase (GH16 family)